MTSQAGPIQQPDGDLVAFDVSKQSPEQIALLFSRWKEQRKQQHHSDQPQHAERPPRLRPMPPIVRAAGQASAPVSEKSPRADPPFNRPPMEWAGQVRYSAPFATVLATRIEPNKALRIWNPEVGLSTLRRPGPSRRHSGLKWILASAASVVALVAVPGDDGLRQPSWQPSGGMQTSSDETSAADAAVVATVTEVASSAAPTYPMDIDMAKPFAAIATAAPVAAEWRLQQTIDLALMKVVPVEQVGQRSVMPRLKPPVPLVRTASKPVEAPKPQPFKPQPFVYPASMPKLRPITPVELRIIPSSAAAVTGISARATIAVPEAPASERPASELGAEAEDGGSASSGQRGNDNDNAPYGSSRIAASADKAPASTGSGGSAHPGSGAGTGGSGDPGGGTGSDPGGSDPSGSDPGGSDPGGSDPGGSDPGGSDPGGSDPGGSDPGGSDPGGSDPGGSEPGGNDPGGSDPGG